MELNLVQTPAPPRPIKAKQQRRFVNRRRFKQQQKGGGGWRGGIRASEVVGPMPPGSAGRKGGGNGRDRRQQEQRQRQQQHHDRSRPPPPPLQQHQEAVAVKRPFPSSKKRPAAEQRQEQEQEQPKERGAAAEGRKRSRIEEKKKHEEEEKGQLEGSELELDSEASVSGSEEEVEMEVEEEDEEDEESGSQSEEEEGHTKEASAVPAVPPPKHPPRHQAADGDSKPSRKHPLPASTADLDAFHAKPAVLDRVVRAAGGAVAAGEEEKGGKSSKHIFSATPFAALGLHERLVSLLSTPREHHGFGLKVATKVQSAAIPALLQQGGDNTNALLCSETGSGKTLAYLLPLLQQLQALTPPPTRADGTYALVVAPTRELCHQIHEVLTKLCRAFIWVVPGMVSGGERRKSEKARLRKGVTVLVGTPGRLLDHLQNTRALKRDRARWLVLDEVDRLLDLGFEAQVREIVGRLKDGLDGGGGGKGEGEGGLQVLAATATLGGAIDRFGRELLGEHLRIDAKTGTVRRCCPTSLPAGGDTPGADEDEEAEAAAAEKEEAFTTPVQLVQQYMLVTCKLRLPALCAFLRVHAGQHKTVVFLSTCDSVDFHHQLLYSSCAWPGDETQAGEAAEQGKQGGLLLGPGLPVHRLHGNIPQAERLQSLRAFSSAKQGVLLCTDVAARGLDLPSVDWIVQYDPPTETAEYVHRVGRTARRGRKGRALLFLLPAEKGYLDVLQRKGVSSLSPLSLQQTLFHATPPRFRERRFRAPEEVFCLELQQRMEAAVAQDKELLARGRKAFGSFVRAYATHPVELKPIFAVRALHLGHVAKSFALKESPTALKVGKEVIKIPGAGKKEKSDDAAAATGGSNSGAEKGKTGKKKMMTTAADFSPPQQQKGKKPRTPNALNSLSEFSAG